jgi:hypothetical protein
MKIFNISLAVLSLISTVALATEETTLMVSIDRNVSQKEVQAAIDALNHRDLTTGTCWVESAVETYIPYTDAPYYGVALVKLTWQCDETAQDYVNRLHADERYTVWANSRIEPFPVVSVRN